MGEKMVDKVLRIAKFPEQIRNIAICAHIDHGKTTLSDNLLAGAGMMSEELAGKACQLDFHADEQERGITIDSASVSMVHDIDSKEFLINLIDTPGHVDFGGDVTRAMRAVDGAVVLVDAVEGMMPQTETVLKQALRERVKPILFINKCDRLIKELQMTPQQMQEAFMKIIVNVNKFIKGIAPEEFKEEWQVNVQDGSVCFGSGFHNWALSIKYMQDNNITFKDIIDAYEGGDHKVLKKKCPLHVVLLNAVVRHLPSPTKAQGYRIDRLWTGDLTSPDGKSLKTCDPKGPLYFVATKIVIDPNAGEVCAGRVFSGTIKRGDNVQLLRAKTPARIQQVSIYNGAKRELVDSIPCGNIVGVVGLKGAYPGETITINSESDPFVEIQHLFDPVVTKAIEATKPADLPKLIEVLRQVGKEDPTIHIEINEETGEHLMSGMGELHLEVIENRIMKEKGVVVKTSPPIVVYREAVNKRSPSESEGKSPNKHNKLYFIVEPVPAGIANAIKTKEIQEGRVKKKEADQTVETFVAAGMDRDVAKKVRDVYEGNVFVDGTKGIIHMGEIIEMVLDMFEDVMRKGPLANEPGINMMVTITDCKLHEDAIHRGPAQLYPAVREGIRDAISTAGATLYEPIQEVQFDAPAEYMGEVSKLISNKRGQLLDMVQEGVHVTVRGKLPVGEMFGLTNELRSATGGRGNFFVVDQTYEKLSEDLQQKIISQIRSRKGLNNEA
jgi:elongation factor 2